MTTHRKKARSKGTNCPYARHLCHATSVPKPVSHAVIGLDGSISLRHQPQLHFRFAHTTGGDILSPTPSHTAMAPSRAPFICASCCKSLTRSSILTRTHAFSTSSTQHQRSRDALPSEDSPRWMKVPHRMRMPLRLRPEPKGPVWKVNTEQAPVDDMYDKFFAKAGGRTHGRAVLPDEIKVRLFPTKTLSAVAFQLTAHIFRAPQWLAITHKSFEHGAMGNSDRLAFLGKRIVDLQTSLALLRSPAAPRPTPPASQVYQHAALENIENMSPAARSSALDKARLAGLAMQYGIGKVMRWKPRKTDDLRGSGEDTVLIHTMYSIIGAVALQSGGAIAARLARERILNPLGLK
nr:hypothetical protein CFP56_29915 [Quercus suber]